MIWNIRKQETTNQNNKKNKECRKKKIEASVSSLWDNFKRSNICIIGVPEREEKEQEIGNLFGKKKMKDLFWKKIAMQVQEA